MLLHIFAGPILLNSSQSSMLIQSIIYLFLLYIALPTLIILWLIYVIKSHGGQKKSPKLLKFNKIYSLVLVVFYALASKFIAALFG
jgi:hypothetical protein